MQDENYNIHFFFMQGGNHNTHFILCIVVLEKNGNFCGNTIFLLKITSKQITVNLNVFMFKF